MARRRSNPDRSRAGAARELRRYLPTPRPATGPDYSTAGANREVGRNLQTLASTVSVVDAAALKKASDLADLSNVVTARSNLGLGSIATQASSSVSITGGTITGITDLAIADGGTGSSTAAGARTNLGLGALAVLSTVSTSEIDDASITYAKMQAVAGNSLIGNPTAVDPDTPQAVGLDATLEFNALLLRRAALTGDVTAAAGSNATTLAAGSASVLNSGTLPAGRMPALTGDVTSSIGTVATTIANNAVTYAKMQDVSATARLIGRATAGAGDPEEISLNATLSFTGTSLQRAALTGDVTASAGSNATTIANAAVTYAKIQNVGAMSLFGRSTNSAGVGADIAAGTAGHVMRAGSGGTSIGWGTLLAGSFTTGPGIVTLAMLDNANALTVTCRSANSSGARGDVALATNAILQNQASVLVSTTAPINLDLSNTGNDLGGLTGAKGRNLVMGPYHTIDAGAGLTAVAGFIDGIHSGVCKAAMPVACKVVGCSINAHHENGSAPGTWTLHLVNDSAGTEATKTFTFNASNDTDSVTTAAMSSSLAFASGAKWWFYIDGPICNYIHFTATFLLVTT